MDGWMDGPHSICVCISWCLACACLHVGGVVCVAWHGWLYRWVGGKGSWPLTIQPSPLIRLFTNVVVDVYACVRVYDVMRS